MWLEQESCELLFPTNQRVIAQISGALKRTLISSLLSFHAAVLRWIDESDNE